MPPSLTDATTAAMDPFNLWGDTIATAWRGSILVNSQVMDMQSNTLNIFASLMTKLNLIARKWVIGVHKCLQVSLMPLLRPWIHSTCGEIQERAFASQTPCYLNPGNGVLSACDLDCSNYLQIFWSIKGSFVKVDTVLESLKGMWNIGEKCTWYSNIRKCYRSIELKDSPVKVIKLKIEKFFSAIKALN